MELTQPTHQVEMSVSGKDAEGMLPAERSNPNVVGWDGAPTCLSPSPRPWAAPVIHRLVRFPLPEYQGQITRHPGPAVAVNREVAEQCQS
jgi:hypothetical protein